LPTGPEQKSAERLKIARRQPHRPTAVANFAAVSGVVMSRIGAARGPMTKPADRAAHPSPNSRIKPQPADRSQGARRRRPGVRNRPGRGGWRDRPSTSRIERPKGLRGRPAPSAIWQIPVTSAHEAIGGSSAGRRLTGALLAAERVPVGDGMEPADHYGGRIGLASSTVASGDRLPQRMSGWRQLRVWGCVSDGWNSAKGHWSCGN
jgi:hypothetical protein